MKTAVRNIYYSFPVQLLFLHFRKSQILLFFWLILFLTVSGHFMKLFGADALFLSPEYLGETTAAATFIVGVAMGVYIMSWNITTFIIHSSRCRFLATTSNPFLKYCLNNSIIPVAFLIVYFIYSFQFGLYRELLSIGNFLLLVAGFTGGLTTLLLVSFAYFFSANRRIGKTIQLPLKLIPKKRRAEPDYGLPVDWYLNRLFQVKKARDVSHYGKALLDRIFNQHHVSAIITILLAFVFMFIVGYFLDKPVVQVPAAASVLIMFAILLAFLGFLSYFLRSWSLLFILVTYVVVNALYRANVIDIRNRAYGLNYEQKHRPPYTPEYLESLQSPSKVEADKENMRSILNSWKEKQPSPKPLMIFFNFSGGGLRGAAFSMRVLQQLDSATQGQIFDRTFMLSGASGGMLAAAYYRELYRRRSAGQLSAINNQIYFDRISRDLLNPIFSAMIARDIFGFTPTVKIQGRKYAKDRGYAFEKKLDANTGGILNHTIGSFAEDEKTARIPLMILGSTITRDLKKMLVSSQPVSFLMQQEFEGRAALSPGPDAIDFAAFFKHEQPQNLRLLTALRMNATYPYVLPAVWLPANPIIDVMDAGLRDNTGQEVTLRFLHTFRDWIEKNTSRILLVQIRSQAKGSWHTPYSPPGIESVITRPFTMLQDNWFNLQEFFQDDEFAYIQSVLNIPCDRVDFTYMPEEADRGVSLNFHLTRSEKKEVGSAIYRENNRKAFAALMAELTERKQEE